MRSAATRLALLAAACGVGGAAAESPEGGASPASILSAIEELESARDAKCNSSANRFEDFLFGTPLSEAARAAHVELQKQLVGRIWSDASARSPEGRRELGAAEIGAELERHVAATRSDGELRAEFPGGVAVRIPGLRADQYASIAYSLRAILGVQQDSVVLGGPPLLELSPEAIERLRGGADVFALAALELADRSARDRSEPVLDAPALRAAWARLLPEAAPAPAAAPPPSDARARSLALLDEIVEGKTAAYRAYNELDQRDTTPLLVFNISRFYARRPMPGQRRERRQLVTRFESELDRFSRELLAAASEGARRGGRPLVRAEDAGAALQELAPHRFDEFEDVHFFERLVPDERVSLEAYDCDSFRDFGIHWRSLQRAAHAAPADSPLPDPFAAELMAEGISNYGVLLLRVAGSLTGREGSVRLAPAALEAARVAIRERAGRHRAAPAVTRPPAPLASAAYTSAPGAETPFRDVTAESGVAFRHRSSRWLGEFRLKQMKTPPTFSGGGVAAEDLDGDGDADLFFVGGGGNALLANAGQGRFVDVTARAGLDWRRPDGSPGEPRQPLIADFDNDGRPDILVTYVDDAHRLYRNLGDLRFEDRTEGSGLGGQGLVGGPATTFDFDGDGRLDVYVGYFGDYLNGQVPSFHRDNRGALPNALLRNLGDLRFADVTEGSGTDDTGWTQAVSHVDLDLDGRQDIVVANDYGRNALLRNLGSGRFENVAPNLGMTDAFHSMNVGVADLNADDHPDVYISNLAMLVKDDKYMFPDGNTPLHFDLRAMAGMLIKESDLLWISEVRDGRLVAFHPSTQVERGPTTTGWAWDAEFFDFDHDGDDDLYLVNGTNDFNVFSTVYAEREADGSVREHLLDYGNATNVLFVNEGGKLRNRSPGSGADFPGNSRATAYLDLEGDGDLDVAVNNFEAPAVVLRNDAPKAGHWMMLRLVGDPARGSNRDAIGAVARVTTSEGRRLWRTIQGGSGYLSSNPKALHLGLGPARSADVEITWPNGEVQVVRGLAADRLHAVRQGETGSGEAEPPSSPAAPRSGS